MESRKTSEGGSCFRLGGWGGIPVSLAPLVQVNLPAFKECLPISSSLSIINARLEKCSVQVQIL